MSSATLSSAGRTASMLRIGLLAGFVALQCAAAGPPATGERARPEPAQPRPRIAEAANLPSSALDPSVASKIRVTSTDAKGNCPAGSTRLDKCSGVYPNGNSWEISPCCRTVVD